MRLRGSPDNAGGSRARRLISKFRLQRRRFALPLLTLIGLFAAVYGAAYLRIAFDYARSMSEPRIDAMSRVPLARRAVEHSVSSALNVLRLPSPLVEKIPTLQLVVQAERLSLLASRNAKTSGLEVDGQLWLKGRWVPVEVSLRGDNIFHWGADLRSYNLEVGRGDTIRGHREIHIVNPKDTVGFSMAFGEHVGANLGLLTPGTEPCRFMLNGVNQGLYLCQFETDESWLRRAGKVPGNLYVGDYLTYGYGSDRASALKLWDEPGLWGTKASVPGVSETRADLALLLKTFADVVSAPANADAQPFLERLELIADVDAFLRLWATQTVSDSDHQDEYHNWRLYFDPSIGRFEPIVWDTLRVWESSVTAAIDRPLPRPLLALFRFPELNQRRYQLLYREVVEPELTNSVLSDWARRYMANTRSTILSGTSVDRIDWVPDVLMWYVVDRWSVLGHQQEEVRFIRRHAEDLGKLLSAVALENTQCMPERDGVLRCRLRMRSHAALKLVGVEHGGGLVGLRRLNNQAMPAFGPGQAAGGLPDFYPAMATAPRPPLPNRYRALFADADLDFELHLASDVANEPEIRLVFRNSITGDEVSRRFTLKSALPAPVREGVYTFAPARREAPKTIRLGPGRVVLRESLVSEIGQSIEVAPGTALLMAPGVSIVAQGPLRLLGEAGRPVSIRPLADSKRWGGLLVVGREAAGSVLRHCDIAGGTIAEHGLMSVKGMVEIAHADRLSIENCRIADNDVGDDTLHVLQSADLSVSGLLVEHGKSDCIDLDYVTGTIEGIVTRQCGNDGIDFMTSVVDVAGGMFAECGDKGASVGEMSNVRFAASVFRDNNIGIQAKDLSQAFVLDGVRFERNTLDLSAYKKSRYYDRGGCFYVAEEHDRTSSLRGDSRLVSGSGAREADWRIQGEGGMCWQTR